MPSDLYAERLRVVSGSSAWTISTMTGSNPNGIASEPVGSLLRTPDGGIWINSNGGTEWQRLGAGVITGSYTATGAEGSQATVTLPQSFQSNQYKVFITNVSGSTVSAYQVPETLRTTTTFKINSTAPFSSGDKLDYLAVSGSIYAGGVTTSTGGGGSTWGTGSVSITSSLPISSVSLTNTGTLDWVLTNYDMGIGATQTSPGSVSSKISGGWLFETVRSMRGATAPSNTSSPVAGTTFTCSTTDNVLGTAASSTTYATLWTSSPTQNNFGFKMRVPARSTQLVLRIFVTVYNCTVTATAALSLSGVSASDSFTIPTSQTNMLSTITFTGASVGDELLVTITCTNNPLNGSLALGAVTLGTV